MMSYKTKYKVQCKIMEDMFGDDWNTLDATRVHHYLAEALNRCIHMSEFIDFLPPHAIEVFKIEVPNIDYGKKNRHAKFFRKSHDEAYSLIQQHMLLKLIED